MLLTNAEKLEAVLAGAITTNQPVFWVDYEDVDDGVTASQYGTLNGVTAVEIAGAPSPFTRRAIKAITIHNADTVDVVCTVRVNRGGTTYPLLKLTLATGVSMIMDQNGAWRTSVDASLLNINDGMAKLAGRSTGQVLYGGVAANEDLTLEPTSHGTKTTADLGLALAGGNVKIAAAAGKVGFFAANPVVQQAHIADAVTNYTTGGLDTEAKLITAINAANGKINSLITLVETFGLTATS